MDVDARVGHLRRVLHRGLVAAVLQRQAVGRGVHDHVLVLVADHVGAVRRRPRARAHGDRHRVLDDAVALDGHRLRRVIRDGDDAVADGEVGGVVLLAVVAVAQVLAVDVDLDVDGRARRPVLGRAPAHLGIVQPVERALDGRLGGDLDGLLRGMAVGDRLVEANRDRLAHAHRRALLGRQVAVGHRRGHDGLEGAGQLLLARLGLQRVGAAVAEVLRGRPGRAVLGQLAGDLLALVVGHLHRIELGPVDLDRHRIKHRPVLGAVLDVGHRLRIGLLDLRGLLRTVALAHGATRQAQGSDAHGGDRRTQATAAESAATALQLNTHVLQSLHLLVGKNPVSARRRRGLTRRSPVAETHTRQT